MKPVLITGATGFLGSHVLHKLRELYPGAKVRILTRRGRAEDYAPEVELVRGDICDPEAVSRAMHGVSRVFHLAGMVSRDPADAPELYRTHVDGTRHVCEAALEFGVERVVLASSSGTIAVSRQPVVHHEDAPFANDVVGRWPYYLSKIFQEKLALACHRQRGLPVVIVNPSLLLGPGDASGRSTRDVVLFLRKKIFGVPPGGLNFVDVRDAAAAVVAAMEKGRAGERYLVGGPNWTFAQFFERLEALSGVKAPRVKFPPRAAALSARLASAWRAISPRLFPITRTEIEMASHFWYLDSCKAQRELGFSPRDPDETLRASIEDARRLVP